MFNPIGKFVVALVLALSTGAALTAQGASGTWSDLSPAADWSNANTASWTGGIVADGAGNTADFSTVNLPGDTSINVVDPQHDRQPDFRRYGSRQFAGQLVA